MCYLENTRYLCKVNVNNIYKRNIHVYEYQHIFIYFVCKYLNYNIMHFENRETSIKYFDIMTVICTQHKHNEHHNINVGFHKIAI